MFRFISSAGRKCLVNSEIKVIEECNDGTCDVEFANGRDTKIKGTIEEVEKILGIDENSHYVTVKVNSREKI